MRELINVWKAIQPPLFVFGLSFFLLNILIQTRRAHPKPPADSSAKWYQKPLRMAALQCNFEEGTNLAVIDKWLEMGFNVEQLFHPMADDYSALYHPEQHQQMLTEYLATARQKNLRIILYLNVHILGPSLAQFQEKWAQRDSNQQIILLYNTYPAICINSPWRDYFFSILNEVAQLDVDGIFLDGPVMARNGCYCEHCQRRCREQFGEVTANRLASYEFNQRTRETFLESAYHHWKKLKPEAIFYINLPVTHATPLFVDVTRELPYNDIVGTEGGFMFYRPPHQAFLWRPGFTAKLLEAIAPHKPRVIFMAADQKSWSWYLHQPAETELCVATSVANGANIWWGLHGSTRLLQTPSGAVSKNIFQFLAKNENYFENTQPLARVGLLYSFTSEHIYHYSREASDFTGEATQSRTPRADLTESLYGFYNMLVRSQIPFTMLTDFDESIETYSKYDCIILPAPGALPPAVVTALREYVRQGGNLIAAYDCSLFDTTGKALADFALADVLGVHFNNEYFTLANHNYFVPTETTRWLFEAIQIPFYPAPLNGISVKADPAAEVLARYLAPLPGRYVPLTSPERPFIVSHKFGAGRSLYFAGAFGQMFHEYAPPEYRKILANAVREFTNPLIEVVNGNAGALELVLRQQGPRWIIHCINHNGDMTRPIERIEPLRELQLQIFTENGFKSARTLLSEQTLSLRSVESGFQLTIPEIKHYEMVVLE